MIRFLLVFIVQMAQTGLSWRAGHRLAYFVCRKSYRRVRPSWLNHLLVTVRGSTQSHGHHSLGVTGIFTDLPILDSLQRIHIAYGQIKSRAGAMFPFFHLLLIAHDTQDSAKGRVWRFEHCR